MDLSLDGDGRPGTEGTANERTFETIWTGIIDTLSGGWIAFQWDFSFISIGIFFKATVAEESACIILSHSFVPIPVSLSASIIILFISSCSIGCQCGWGNSWGCCGGIGFSSNTGCFGCSWFCCWFSRGCFELGCGRSRACC